MVVVQVRIDAPTKDAALVAAKQMNVQVNCVKQRDLNVQLYGTALVGSPECNEFTIKPN